MTREEEPTTDEHEEAVRAAWDRCEALHAEPPPPHADELAAERWSWELREARAATDAAIRASERARLVEKLRKRAAHLVATADKCIGTPVEDGLRARAVAIFDEADLIERGAL